MTLKKFMDLARDMTNVDEPDEWLTPPDAMREFEDFRRRMQRDAERQRFEGWRQQQESIVRQQEIAHQRRRLELQRAVAAPPSMVAPDESAFLKALQTGYEQKTQGLAGKLLGESIGSILSGL